jgi:CheY-like chemotaxis protein
MTARRLAAAASGQPESPLNGRAVSTVAAAPHCPAAPPLRIVLGGCQIHSSMPAGQRGPTADPKPPGRPDGTMLAGRVALVVDDEPMILEILAEHCTSLGMKVSEAADGEGALRLVRTQPEIEVLVTDVRMPGLDGPALVEKALALRPGIRVIFVTGYTTYRSSTWPILRKPFDLDELEAALRRTLIQKDQGPE